MKSECVSWPTREPLIIIRESSVKMCGGNHCAAALLSFFAYWHNIKLDNSGQAEAENKVAVAHGEEPTQNTGLWQYHTSKELSRGLVGLYGKDSISAALDILVELGVIEIGRNPNPKYSFDATRHFLFHPEVVNEWNSRYEKHNGSLPFSAHRSAKNSQRSPESSRAIPKTTTETTVTALTSNEVKVAQAQPAHTNGAHQKAVGESGTLVSPSFFDEPTFGEVVKPVNGKGQSGTTNSSARKQKKVADPEKVAQDWLWIERLADILGMDSKINAGRLGKTRNALRSSGYTLDDLDIYAREVWPSSWKAKNEAHPKENDLREGILEARKIRERRTGRVEPAVRADGMFTLADPFGENLVVK